MTIDNLNPDDVNAAITNSQAEAVEEETTEMIPEAIESELADAEPIEDAEVIGDAEIDENDVGYEDVSAIEGQTEVEDAHKISYSRNGEEFTETLTYDENGRLSQEHVDEFIKLKAKMGLEKTAQDAIEASKEWQKRFEAAQIRASEIERKHLESIGPFAKHVEMLKNNPQAVAAFEKMYGRQMGITQPTRYDAEKVRLQYEAEQGRIAQVQQKQRQFFDKLDMQMYEKFPDLTPEQRVELVRSAVQDGGFRFDDSVPEDQKHQRWLNRLALERDAQIARGKLPNPNMMKAKAEAEKAKAQLKQAKKRASVRTTSAGRSTAKGGTRSVRSLKGASTDDLVAEFMRMNK
ncbi:MAG: hypothetical protein DRP45_04855 [Candidatus Zixiibacteriota bacterium]|nr:MAG: hypothetical protein DRP45_04855 [candidate division Zixibacteria bacterium]